MREFRKDVKPKAARSNPVSLVLAVERTDAHLQHLVEPQGGHLADAGAAADLGRSPPGGPGRLDLAGSSDPAVLFGPRPHRAVTVGAHPAALVPDEAHRSAEHRKIDQLHPGAALRPGDHATPRTAG